MYPARRSIRRKCLTTSAIARVVIAMLAAGCASGPAREPAPAPAVPPAQSLGGECVRLAPDSASVDSLSLAATAEVNPADVSRARNAAERFIFAQLYEPLLGVDCTGELVPALAEHWTSEDGGRRWRVELRPDARFWSGEPVTAAAVVASWAATASRDSAADPDSPAARLLRAATVVDPRTLSVALPDDMPLAALADPALAVYRPRAASPWPEGSGPFAVDAPGAGARRLSIRTVSRSGARDLLDGGTELLVTDDPATIAYASAGAAFASFPLPWDRSYVLLSSRRTPDAPAPTEPAADSALEALRTALARDAVRAEARASQPPYWWQAAESCQPSGSAGAPAGSPRQPLARIAYRAGDEIAGALAARLVALASFEGASVESGALTRAAPELRAGGRRPTAVALAPAEFAADLRAGASAAYVIALPRDPASFCAASREITGAAPWLRAGDGLALSRSILPLVDSRSRLIVRRGRVGLVAGADGALRLVRESP